MESGEPILETEQIRKFISDRLSTAIEELAKEFSASQEAGYRMVCEERDCLLRRLEELEEQRHQSEAALIAVPAGAVEPQGPQPSASEVEVSAQDAAALDDAVPLSSAVIEQAGESASATGLSSLAAEAPQPVTEDAAVGRDTDEIGATYFIQEAAELKQRNQELEAEVGGLRTEMDRLKQEQSEVAGLRERLVQFEVLERERNATREQLEKARQELAALEEELKRVMSDRERQERDLRREQSEVRKSEALNVELRKALKLAEKDRVRSAAEVAHLNESLASVRAELDQANQNLSMCQSAREVLRVENGKLEQSSRRARDEYNWEVALRLSPMLASLSALAGLEPNETHGLSTRSVFEDFRRWVEQVAGGRLEPVPAKGELSGDVLWLDADTLGLESLMERYDWAGERPFEGLPTGQRKRAFRLSRRGWAVGKRVVARAFVTAVLDEPTQPDEADAGADQE
jgi:hypothetical protein